MKDKSTTIFEWLVFAVLIAIILIPIYYIIKKYETTPVQAGLLGVVCGMLFMRIAKWIVKAYEKKRSTRKTS